MHTICISLLNGCICHSNDKREFTLKSANRTIQQTGILNGLSFDFVLFWVLGFWIFFLSPGRNGDVKGARVRGN